MNNEQHALGRVLLIAKAAYAAIADGETAANVPALLDSLSAILSHLNDEKQPINKLLGKFKRTLRSKNKAVYLKTQLYFNKLYPVADFDLEKAAAHIPAIISANDKICVRFVSGDMRRVKTMCDAMKSYPGYLLGEYEALSDEQFYDLVFGYYPKLYNDEFMGDMKHLFTGEEKPEQTNII